MMAIPKDILFYLSVVLLHSPNVECTGRLAIQLVEFHNPNGLGKTGQCCDGVNIPGCPTEKCDHHFALCVGKPQSPNSNDTKTSCQYGQEEFNAPDNTNDLLFSDGKSSLFSFDVWKGTAQIIVNVTDSDTDGSEPVDNFEMAYNTSIVGFNSTAEFTTTYTLQGQRTVSPTSLSFKVKVYCDPHFYGDDCSINCVADDTCQGHYTCDSQGRKVCKPGWKGTDCDVQIPGDVADCSIYQDRKEFVPSLWEGQYRCPGDAVQNFMLNTTRSSGDISVVADMTIQSVVIPLTGSYASALKVLTLQGKSLVPQVIKGRNLTGLELNLQEKGNPTEMEGSIIIDQNTCPVLNLTRTLAFFDGCNFQGTCVRYGAQKDQFYCCCSDGSVGLSCAATTKKPTVVTTAATKIPTTESTTPTTKKPTTAPTTNKPTTTPSTIMSTTQSTTPSTMKPTTTPTSKMPTTESTTPTTKKPTTTPATKVPTTESTTPTTKKPTTMPTTKVPTTESTAATTNKTTTTPSTMMPTTESTTPSTMMPTTTPTTKKPTTTHATKKPTTTPTTKNPTTPSTMKPTTESTTPTTKPTTTHATKKPTTTPTTKNPTTTPSTMKPTTTPTTKKPTTTPSTMMPTTESTTPTTKKPTTTPSTKKPTTPTTKKPTTTPTTNKPTTAPTTKKPTTTPTTNKPTTESHVTTLQSSSSKTTAIPGHYTTRPSTPTTTVQESSTNTPSSAAKSSTVLPSSTASTSSTRIPLAVTTLETTSVSSTSTRTTPTTPKVAASTPSTGVGTTGPLPSTKNITQHVLLELVKEELDTFIIIGIIKAWSFTNAGKGMTVVNFHILNVSNSSYIGDNGLDVVEVSLTFNVPYTAVEPTMVVIESQIQHVANTTNVKLYRGSTTNLHWYRVEYALTFFVVGVGPRDDQKVKWQSAIIEAVQKSCAQKCSSLSNTTVTIKKTEEYVGSDGMELTKIYYFVERNGKPLERISQNATTIEVNYTFGFESKGLNSVKIYSGTTVLRYRFHYTLLIEGQVLQKDLPKFKTLIQNTWIQEFPNSYGGCSLCNFSIERIEQYTGDGGMTVSALVYFFHFQEKVQSPTIVSPPSVASYGNISLTDNELAQYKLYTGSVRYRYSYHYSFLITGQASNPFSGMTNLQEALTSAWTNWTITNKGIYPNYVSWYLNIKANEVYLSGEGQFVTNFVCYLIDKEGRVHDSRLVVTPTLSWLSQKTQTLSSFVHGNGQPYQVYTSHTELFRLQDTFVIYVRGYVYKPDIPTIETTIQEAWNESVVEVSARILKTVIYMRIVNGNEEIATALHYRLYYSTTEVTIVAAQISVEEKNKANQLINSKLGVLSLGRIYQTLTVDVSSWFAWYSHFELYFTTRIEELDLEIKAEKALLNALEAKWNEYSSFKNLEVHIAFQEKVFLEKMSVWRVVFFLRYPDKGVIDPTWVTPITETLLNGNISITSLQGHTYDLYLGERSADVNMYRSHFHLTFTQEVSEYDYNHIKKDLQGLWCNKIQGCQNSSEVEIRIKDQEHYLDIQGVSYWRLVYFVRYGSVWFDSRFYRDIDWLGHRFTWLNQYNVTYSLVTTRHTDLWLFSYSFNLYYHSKFYNTQIEKDKVKSEIQAAWSKMGIPKKECRCLSVSIARQRELMSARGTLWQLTYFLRYNNQISHNSWTVDSRWWPTLNTSTMPLHLIGDVDTMWYQHIMAFYSNHKVSVTDFSSIEKHMTDTLLVQNPGFQACGCYKVKVEFQEEVIDSSGHSAWKLYYHVYKDGVAVSMSKVRPFDWSYFSKKYPLIGQYQHHYNFSWQWLWQGTFTPYSNLGGVYLSHWLPYSNYQHLVDVLSEYYSSYYNGSKNITISVKTPAREYYTVDGSSAWHIPFILQVDGSQTYPPPINNTVLQASLNMSTARGDGFTLIAGAQVVSTEKFTSITTSHKVATSVYENVKTAIINTLVQQYPEWKSSQLKIDIGPQREVVDEKGHSSWKLYYSLSVNGTKVDTKDTQILNSSVLTTQLQKVVGPNTVHYHLVHTSGQSTGQVSTDKLMSVYFRDFVSVVELHKVEEQIEKVWEEKFGGSTNVTATFFRQKQYVNANGMTSWKWDYTLKVNGTVVRPETVEPIDVGQLTSNVTHPVPETVSYTDHEMLFPVYLVNKVAQKDIIVFKQKIQKAWLAIGENVTVDGVTQEELVDEKGQSSWKLLYSVKKGKKILDSRVTQNINSSDIGIVTGPKGPYHYRNTTSGTTLHRYSLTGSLFSSHKLDRTNVTSLRAKIKNALEQQYTALKNRVSVDIVRQEEYMLINGEREYKTAFLVKVDGELVPASSFSWHFLDGEIHGFNTTTTGYNFRNRFTVTLSSKIAQKSFESLKSSIIGAWKLTKKEFQNCSLCVYIYNITENNIEEVVDLTGKTYWQLSYFLFSNQSSNQSLVDSMTHVPLNLTHLKTQMTHVTDAKDMPYSVVDTSLVSVTPLRLSGHFYLDREIGLHDKSQLQNITKAAWISMNVSLEAQSLAVEIIRMSRYVEPSLYNSWRTIWRVDYFLKEDGVILDPAVLPGLEFSGFPTLPSPHGTHIKLLNLTHGADEIDYRWRFQLTADKEVRFSHLKYFRMAIVQYWSSVHGKANVGVFIPEQVKMVTSKGVVYWSMSVFVYDKTSSKYIDSQVYRDLNVTQIEGLVSAKGLNSSIYTLISKSKLPTGLRRYDTGLTIYLSSFIKRTHLTKLSTHLALSWKTKDFSTATAVTTDIVKQEQVVTVSGKLASKLTYFLQVDGVDIHSSRVSDLNHTDLQRALSAITVSTLLDGIIEPVSGTTQSVTANVYSYSSLFSFTLARPLVDQDRSEMELLLAEAWTSQMTEAGDNLAFKVSMHLNQQIKIDLNTSSSRQTFDLFRIGFSILRKSSPLLYVYNNHNGYLLIKIDNTGTPHLYIDSGSERQELLVDSAIGKDFTLGEQHILEVYRRGNLIHMKIDDFPEVYCDCSLWIENITTLIIGNNDTNQSWNGLDGQIFFLQVDDFYPLGYAFQNPTPSNVHFSPEKGLIKAVPYGISVDNQPILKSEIKDSLPVLSVKILHQDEFVTKDRSSMWKVMYAITTNTNAQVSSTQESSLSNKYLLEAAGNLTRTGSSGSYEHYIVTGDDKTGVTFRYTDLYHVYVNQRVGVSNYPSIQANLTTLWKTVENLTRDVTMVKQEKVVNTKGHLFWKLSYYVATKDRYALITPKLVDGPGMAKLRESIVTVSPQGALYKVVDVRESFRLSQSFQFVVNRRVQIQDEGKVTNDLLGMIGSNCGGCLTSLEVKASRTEEVLDRINGELAWQYNFVVSANDTVVDSSYQPELNVSSLNQILMSVGGEAKYQVKQSQFWSYSDTFGLTLLGQVSSTLTQHITEQLTLAWNQHSTVTKMVVSNLLRQEFIGENGATITKYQYFVEKNNSLVYPSLTPVVSTTELVHNLSVTLYKGSLETNYHDCYGLPLKGQHGYLNTTAIIQVLQTTWSGSINSTGTASSNYSINILKREKMVGNYGLSLLKLVYTVNRNGITVTPDYQSSPNVTLLAGAVSKVSESVVYTGQQDTFRVSGLYWLGLKHKNSSAEITKTDKSELENVIRTTWKASKTGEVKIEILSTEEYRSVDTRRKLNKVLYAVKIDGKTKENWEESIANLKTKLASGVSESTQLQNKFNVTGSLGDPIRSLYLQGWIKSNTSHLTQALNQAWQLKTNGSMVQTDIITQQRFVTSTWNYATKIQYVVSINETNPKDQDVYLPSYQEFEDKLATVHLTQSNKKSLKFNRKYIRGARSSLNYTSVRVAMQAAWVSKNNDTANMLHVSVRHIAQRHRRASTDSYRLVDDTGHEISPMEYTVALNGEDPSPIYMDTPSDTEIDAELGGAGTGLCGCKPRLAAKLKVKGQVSEADKDKVVGAVKQAFIDKNSDVKSKDLDIELSISNTTDSNGHRSSDVDYILTRTDDGDVEDLVRPDEAKLTSDIQSMYSKMEKVEEPEEDDWVIPVAVVCGIIVFILIVIIICYIIYSRRHRKKGDLLKREENVKNKNMFDKEHFSDPAMLDDQGPLKYDNPSYESVAA